MIKHEPLVEFCIKIIENGEIYYESGTIDEIPEDFSKKEAIAKLKRACRDNGWYLADITYLVFSYWHNGEQVVYRWIDLDFENNYIG